MTPTEFRDLLASLGWSQRVAAYNLGVPYRLLRHWCAGSRPIPTIAALALRGALADKVKP